MKSQLKKVNIAFDSPNPFEETIESTNEYDPDQGERILGRYITEDLAKRYFSMFWGREDVYAKRGKNGGYFPQCDNRWNDALCPKQRGKKMFYDDCEHTKWTNLDLKKIVSHLVGKKEDGTDVLGVYPLLPDALRKMCEQNGIRSLVERSRSGRGAHVWIFFKRPIATSLARNFGFLLLDKGSASINLKSFHYYDRMYPSKNRKAITGRYREVYVKMAARTCRS